VVKRNSKKQEKGGGMGGPCKREGIARFLVQPLAITNGVYGEEAAEKPKKGKVQSQSRKEWFEGRSTFYGRCPVSDKVEW